ncbi:DUF2809 domain-containing protein [Oerskovia sp. KBS0722]|uniref:DUF2809 domain-containing protein n=1 Tax=Oerskovia sp. KBS0722 TaxID=1179673 RepID=UPI00110E23A9|nr:DUF2809 domain-containing protein [Oerskovia sp. KBS0722]QDW62241.1 DUF2809 domain-containing protein [Oerskovia sp. KBS0722]
MTSGETPVGRPGRAPSPRPARRRSRPRVLATLAALVVLGLVVTTQVPDPVGDVVGDLMYAVAVYVALVLVAPRLRPWVAGAVAFTWCWLVEILQATPVVAAVLDVVPAAAWVLGSTFNARDLVLYLLGVLLAVGLDVLLGVRASQVSERA